MYLARSQIAPQLAWRVGVAMSQGCWAGKEWRFTFFPPSGVSNAPDHSFQGFTWPTSCMDGFLWPSQGHPWSTMAGKLRVTFVSSRCLGCSSTCVTYTNLTPWRMWLVRGGSEHLLFVSATDAALICEAGLIFKHKMLFYKLGAQWRKMLPKCPIFNIGTFIYVFFPQAVCGGVVFGKTQQPFTETATESGARNAAGSLIKAGKVAAKNRQCCI